MDCGEIGEIAMRGGETLRGACIAEVRRGGAEVRRGGAKFRGGAMGRFRLCDTMDATTFQKNMGLNASASNPAFV